MYVPAASGVVGLTDQLVPVRGALSVGPGAPDGVRAAEDAHGHGRGVAGAVAGRAGQRRESACATVKPGPGPVIASAGPMACEPRTQVAADSLPTRSASTKTTLS